MASPTSERHIKGKFTGEQFLDFTLTCTLIKAGFTETSTLALILGVDEHIITAHKQGFAGQYEYHKYLIKQRGFDSPGEYREQIAKQRTNPETGKPFNSFKELQDYLARQRGFASKSEYRKLTYDKTALIIAVLKDSGMPMSIEDIYSHLSENFGIMLDKKRGGLERTIDLANRLMPKSEKLFIERAGAYRLNLGSSYLHEIIRGKDTV